MMAKDLDWLRKREARYRIARAQMAAAQTARQVEATMMLVESTKCLLSSIKVYPLDP
jgi:hypothetical protein